MDPRDGVPQTISDDYRPRQISTSHLRPGGRIGRYQIRSQLGRGGMGVVYGAFDPVLGRRVALKLVRHRDSLDSVEVHVDERLRREAQALARLSHPNVVALYDVGSCAHGDYLALELVPGVNLDRWLRKSLRSWQEILEVFLQAGAGLAAAHTASLIHRDFKPSNVIVGPNGHVTVVDFGLARSAEMDTTMSDPRFASNPPEEELLSTRLTATNIIVGTHGYMAPEQLLGLTVGPRADQFSFCVSLFEALYGVRPFPGENPVEVARAYSENQRTEFENTRQVPQRLHQVLMRGLSIDANGRYPSMDALMDALRRATTRRQLPKRWIAALVATAALSGAAGAMLDRMMSSPSPAAEVQVQPASASAAVSSDQTAMAPTRRLR